MALKNSEAHHHFQEKGKNTIAHVALFHFFKDSYS
jgi:hypothetical protein